MRNFALSTSGMPVSNGRSFDSGYKTILGQGDVLATDLKFCPLSPPMRTADLETFEANIWMRALGSIKARAAVQFSDNGRDWTAAVHNLTSNFKTTAGWSYGAATHDLYNLSGTDPAPFVRFGLQTLNVSGSLVESAEARLVIFFGAVTARTITVPLSRVHTGGSTSTSVVNPVTGPIDASRIAAVRAATMETATLSDDIDVRVIWQQSDDPTDVTLWASGGTINFGSSDAYISTETTTTGTTFTTVAPTKRTLRFCIEAINGAGTDIEAGLVGVVIDTKA